MDHTVYNSFFMSVLRIEITKAQVLHLRSALLGSCLSQPRSFILDHASCAFAVSCAISEATCGSR